MANFIKKTLEPGEKIVYMGRLHWYFKFRYTALGTFLILLGIGAHLLAWSKNMDTWMYYVSSIIALVGIILIAYGYFLRSKTEFAVTNTRFIQKDGVFSVQMTEIPLFKVETVNFYQSFLERLIHTGAIELVGSGGTNHKVEYVKDPFKVRNLITTYMKENKKDPQLSKAEKKEDQK